MPTYNLGEPRNKTWTLHSSSVGAAPRTPSIYPGALPPEHPAYPIVAVVAAVADDGGQVLPANIGVVHSTPLIPFRTYRTSLPSSTPLSSLLSFLPATSPRALSHLSVLSLSRLSLTCFTHTPLTAASPSPSHRYVP